MNRLTKFSKVVLFITSYIPLGIIFLIIDFDKFSFPFFKKPIFSFLLLAVILLLAISLMVFLIYFHNKSSPVEIMKVIKVENMNAEILSYIFTYILPFLGFPAEKQIPVSFFILIIIGILYIKSEMIGINPMLSLFGYHILKVETGKDDWKSTKEIVMISKAEFSLVKHSEFISAMQIHENLYLFKEVIHDDD